MDQPGNAGPVPKPARPKTQNDRNCSILVVDDNQGALALAELVITAFGWTVTKASSGSEALRLLQGEAVAFDCVLTDLTMPGMSGIELARAIGTVEEKPRIPVLALSADPPARFGDAAGDSAFQGYVPKPYTPELLYDALMEAMNVKADP